MKKIFVLAALILVASCKNSTKEDITIKNNTLEVNVNTRIYPENLNKVFDAHGGLDAWNEMQNLVFTMLKPNGDEVTTTHLKNRKSHIEMPKHTIGYNGKEVWLKHKDTTAYKGKPRFYYNLMFYFYAMPFVLADEGIVYKDVDPLVYDGKKYPGIKISYTDGVGESPEDEYILYYDAETYKMAWLGYTVTYFSKEKSQEFHFINYSNWQTVEELLVPEILTWYNVENNMPTTKRSDLKFTNIVLSTGAPEVSLFEKPEGAKVAE